MDNTLSDAYSPVAEAERYTALAAPAGRLDAAQRVLESPMWRWMDASLRQAPAAAVARHLDGAAHVLIGEGWTQNQMRAANGGVCLAKALMRAADLGYGDQPEQPGVDFQTTTYYVAGSYLNLMVLARTGRPDWYLAWNDQPGRTAGEVLELVRDAADFARVR